MDATRRAVSETFRAHGGAVTATLIRHLGSFDRAEDALMDAMAAALKDWPVRGVPQNPAAWLTTTARRKAIDRLRRDETLADRKETLKHEGRSSTPAIEFGEPIPDDQLRLIFTCCHPILPLQAQVGLTLRTLCGLTSVEIAKAFLVPLPTLQQRLSRAKKKIASAKVPYQVPEPDALPQRVEGVLAAIYLVFNEGYVATSGEAHARVDLCAEAIRLATLVNTLLPEQPEVEGLLALMRLHHARRAARVDASGGLVLLEAQDRQLWDHEEITRAADLVTQALRRGQAGPYQIQAAIAALHAQAETAEATDWAQIAALYSVLYSQHPSPVTRLNQAVAIAMAEGPDAGLAILDALTAEGRLADYPYLPAARADLLRRAGRHEAAVCAYSEALALTQNSSERTYLRGRRDEMRAAAAAQE